MCVSSKCVYHFPFAAVCYAFGYSYLEVKGMNSSNQREHDGKEKLLLTRTRHNYTSAQCTERL
jgi:hypothetical protein